jgi:hypothetical protein
MTKNTQGPLYQTNYNLMDCFKTGTILGPFFMLKRAFEEATIWPCHPWDGLRKKKELDGFASLDSFKEPIRWDHGWFRKGMAMDQQNIKTYLLKIDFCTNLCHVSWEWTSICQLFSCSPGYQDVPWFSTQPYLGVIHVWLKSVFPVRLRKAVSSPWVLWQSIGGILVAYLELVVFIHWWGRASHLEGYNPGMAVPFYQRGAAEIGHC